MITEKFNTVDYVIIEEVPSKISKAVKRLEITGYICPKCSALLPVLEENTVHNCTCGLAIILNKIQLLGMLQEEQLEQSVHTNYWEIFVDLLEWNKWW